MKRTKLTIIALVLSLMIMIPIGVYGYFVVYAKDYVEIWESEKKKTKKSTTEEAKPEETTAPATEQAPVAQTPQPVAVIVGERKKDVTPKTADFELEPQYMLCIILALTGISILLLSKSMEFSGHGSKEKAKTPEKRKWEIAWEESRKAK